MTDIDRRRTLESEVIPKELADSIKRYEALCHGRVARDRLGRLQDSTGYPDAVASDRLRCAFFDECIQRAPPHRALDVGTGQGTWAVRLAKYADKVLAIDLSEEMLAVAKEYADGLGLRNIEFLQADAENTKLPDCSFDMITHFSVLMHLPNPEAALREVYKFLVPGGYLLLETWNAQWLIYQLVYRRKHARGRSVHLRHRFMTLQELKEMLVRCGFEVQDVSFGWMISDYVVGRFCSLGRRVRVLNFLLFLARAYYTTAFWIGRRLGRQEGLRFLFREHYVLARKPSS